MSRLKSPSSLEKVTGSLATESALTAIAAIVGGPLSALLPALAKSLAAERQKKRLGEALVEMDQILQAHHDQIRNLTDEQYKIINETILALFQTTHEKKLKYLRSAVKNALTMQNLESQEASILSRVVRDISAEEAAYILGAFSYSGIHLMAAPEGQQFTDNILRVDPSSRDALLVSGLMSLGLLVPAEPTWGAPNILRFSGVVAKLIVLLQGSDA